MRLNFKDWILYFFTLMGSLIEVTNVKLLGSTVYGIDNFLKSYLS